MDLEATSTSPARARRFVDEQLRLWECDDPAEVVALLTSEMVANAVMHAATPVTLAMALDGDILRVEAEDGCPDLPRPRSAEWDEPGGRGLALIEALARRWGAQPRGDGKVVWFEYGPC